MFVSLPEGVKGTFPAKTDPAVIDQKGGCLYGPRVVGLQVGQPLKFTNSDQTLHNVHGMPKVNAPWNFAMPKFVKQKENKDPTKPEVMIHVKCDVHPWMSGYVGVLEHPFFAVTDKDGNFTIDGVPPGESTPSRCGRRSSAPRPPRSRSTPALRRLAGTSPSSRPGTRAIH